MNPSHCLTGERGQRITTPLSVRNMPREIFKNLQGCSPRIHLGLQPRRSPGFLSFATADGLPPYIRIVTAGLDTNLPRPGAVMARLSQPAVTPGRALPSLALNTRHSI
jgi:hypothetical protein